MIHGLSDQTETARDKVRCREFLPLQRHFRWPVTGGIRLAEVTATCFAPREVVLEVSGEIDLLTAPLLETALREQLAAVPRVVVLDFGGCHVLRRERHLRAARSP
jgi:hypothetical protein